MRLDQQPASRNRSGSGLPCPWNGSRNTASTRSRTRIAVFRSVLTQYRRSYRNSEWKMANRLPSLFTENLSPQIGDALGFHFAPARPMQGRQQSARVPWRTEQVSGLDQPRQFIRRNKSHVSRPSASNDDRLPLIHDLIQNAGQVRAQARICGFRRHEPPCYIVQDSCTRRIGRTLGRGTSISTGRINSRPVAANREAAWRGPRRPANLPQAVGHRLRVFSRTPRSCSHTPESGFPGSSGPPARALRAPGRGPFP